MSDMFDAPTSFYHQPVQKAPESARLRDTFARLLSDYFELEDEACELKAENELLKDQLSAVRGELLKYERN